MPVGDAFLSAFLQVLFDRLASRELLKLAQLWNVESVVRKLALTVSLIKTEVLEDAEEKQVKNAAVKIWMDDLQEVVDDAENVLDEFATEALRCQVENQCRTTPSSQVDTIFTTASSYASYASSFVFNRIIEFKMKEITMRLEDIAKRTVELGLGEYTKERFSISDSLKRLPTTSLVDDCVYGRKDDVEKMLKLLLSDEEPMFNDGSLRLLPIVGLGGVGKTRVAQIVYNDPTVKNHFDLKAWVYVSDGFNLVSVTKSILESLGESCDYTTLEPLQNKLRDILMCKKFLLILDDVWSDNNDKWELLQRPLKAGAKGSTVIITTRYEGTAQELSSTLPVFRLKELCDDDCWSLFERHAFANIIFDESSADFKKIGKEIMKKCKGLPLAAKTVGSLLRYKRDVDEWKYILSSELWVSAERHHGILPALSLSYHHLPSHLKPCFAYCSLFPKGYEFKEEEIIRLWIAQGFVMKPKENKQIEHEAKKNFRDLLSRSLFQYSSTGVESRFTMHDLINDLAKTVAGGSCVTLPQNKTCEKVRHLSFVRSKHDTLWKFEALCSNESLRTFLPLDGGFGMCRLTNKVIHDLLPNFMRLRVLSLSHYDITELPNSIGDLKHLRHFNISQTGVQKLPDAVATLYNLQTLILYDCRRLTELPKHMGNLINLRHLDIRGTSLRVLPPGMSRLINLQTLHRFIVGINSGSGIQELENLSHLQGELSIVELQNVENPSDVMYANVREKHYLDRLVLKWSRNVGAPQDDSLMMDVLDMLEPHINIKNLSIEGYGGTRFSSWLGDPFFSNIVSLVLINCEKCTSLPPFGQLSSLEELNINGMNAIKSIGCEFYGDGDWSATPFQSLKILKFNNMHNWKEWSSSGGEAYEFPCLHELSLHDCPNLLKDLPILVPSLVTLNICNCKELSVLPRLPTLQYLVLEGCDQVILRSVFDIKSLTMLKICKISNLKVLPEGFLQSLTSLEDLEVGNCDEIESLSNQVRLPYHTSLRRLVIWKCPLISMMPEEEHGLPLILERLEIRNCNNLKKLPCRLQDLVCLSKLSIVNCPIFESFSEMGIPCNLGDLEIRGCGALLALPEGLMHNKNSSLEYLVIDGCSSLTSFPKGELPSTLKRLQILCCSNLKLLPDRLMQNMSLESLLIHGCPLISFSRSHPRLRTSTSTPTSSSISTSTSIPSSSSISTSSLRLKELEIRDCTNLVSLPVDLNKFICLDKLVISNCPSLESFPEGGLPLNLTSLSISECLILKSLPSRMHNLTSLQELTINSCPLLDSFPQRGLPTCLKSLCITGCKKLPPLSRWELHKLRFLKNNLIMN